MLFSSYSGTILMYLSTYVYIHDTVEFLYVINTNPSCIWLENTVACISDAYYGACKKKIEV